MKTLESRVTTVPHHPSLAKALQQDMLASATHIRNALYDNYQPELVSALIALDMPHFIPIENLDGELVQEWKRLVDLIWEVMNSEWQDPEVSEKVARIDMQISDIENYLHPVTRLCNICGLFEALEGHEHCHTHRPLFFDANDTDTTEIPDMPDVEFAEDDCSGHFPGGWYYTTDGQLRMAVPPHMGVDAGSACPKCQGWLSYPANFSHWRNEGGES